MKGRKRKYQKPNNRITQMVGPNGCLTASIGGKYEAFFGRDSALIAMILLHEERELAKNTIMELARLQGTKECDKTEESPGKIHHEARDDKFGNYLNRSFLNEVINILWNSNEADGLRVTYFSADSTPLFIKLVHNYVQSYDADILDEVVVGRTGQKYSIAQAVERAADYLAKIRNKEGLLEIPRRNFFGNFFGQTWKDSLTAYINPDGSLVRATGRIVLPEIQTLGADALEEAAELCQKNCPEKSREWKILSTGTKIATLKKFWNPETEFFGSCLAEKPKGKLTLVATLESSAARMLDSNLFSVCDDKEKDFYVRAIAAKIFSDDFLCDAGIRSRALVHERHLNFWDYHGSMVSWPIDTYIVAQGLRRQGLDYLATQLEHRVLNAIDRLGYDAEFIFVDYDGHIISDSPKKERGQKKYAVQMKPEKRQGWTIALDHDLRTKENEVTTEPKATAFEAEIMADKKPIKRYHNPDSLIKNYQINLKRLSQNSGLARTAGYLIKNLFVQLFK